MPDDQMPALQPPAPPPQALTGSPEQTPQPSTVKPDGGVLGESALGALAGATKQVNTPPEPTSDPATGMVFNPSGESTPDIRNVKVFSPTGEIGEVPSNRVEDAIKAGGKLAVPMVSPDGKQGFVPQDRYQDALKAGGKYDDGYKDARRIAAVMGGMSMGAVLGPLVAEAAGGGLAGSVLGGAAGGAGENITRNIGEGENPFRPSNAVPLVEETVGGGLAGGVVHGAATGVGKVAQVVKNAVTPEEIGDVTANMFKKVEVPRVMHGEVARVPEPFDRATVDTMAGGKNLSQEAVDTLQQYTGDTIPVGSSKKNLMISAIPKVNKTIEETGMAMNKLIDEAPAFKTSVMQDQIPTDGKTWGKLRNDLVEITDKLPASEKAKLSQDVSGEWESAQKALNSTDPHEILAYKRKLGEWTDWNNLTNNPQTPAEVQDLARAKIYNALGAKLNEIDGVADLNKVFQPNLELRSHLRAKLGTIADDSVLAHQQHLSEFKKGQTLLQAERHNAKAKRNLEIALGLGAAGVGGALYEAGATGARHAAQP